LAFSETARASSAARCAWSISALLGSGAGAGAAGVEVCGTGGRDGAVGCTGVGVGADETAGSCGARASIVSSFGFTKTSPIAIATSTSSAISLIGRPRGAGGSGGMTSSPRRAPPRRGVVVDAPAGIRCVGVVSTSVAPNNACHASIVCGRCSGSKASALSIAARNGCSKRSAWVMASGR